MGILENILIIIFLVLVLIFFTRVFIKSLLNISFYFNFSDFIISFIFGGIATSLPEFLFGFQSSLKKVSNLSLGNIIGANFNDVTLVIALSLIFNLLQGRNSYQELKISTKEFLATFLVIITPFIVALKGKFGIFESIVCLILFSLYLYYIFKENKFEKLTKKEIKFKEFFQSIIYLLISLIILIISSYLIVSRVKFLVEIFGISSFAFGALLLSFGTTLPELVFSYQTLKENLVSFAFGNIFGSLVFNSNFILAFNGIINEFYIESSVKLLINILLLSVAIIFNFYFLKYKREPLSSALFLISLWLLFAVLNFIFLF